MSGKCHSCGEHCLECKCEFKIRVWSQMFFDDGSVSQAIRVGAEVFDDPSSMMMQMAIRFLTSLNRQEGLLLVWGAGEMFTRYYVFPTFSSLELSASDS